MRLAAKWALGLLLGGALAYGLHEWTVYNGHQAIIDLARERGQCQTEQCEEGADVVYAVVQANEGWSRHRTDWCVGVDDWAATRVHRGGWLKAIAVEIMYWPCPMKEAPEE